MSDDVDIDAEFAKMMVQFEKAEGDMVVANFNLPEFAQFLTYFQLKDVLEESGLLKVIDGQMSMSDLDMLSSMMLFIMNDDLTYSPRPDEMTDDEWMEHTVYNSRVCKSLVGKWLISAAFTGVAVREDPKKHESMFETAVFLHETRELVEGPYSFATAEEAMDKHDELVIRYMKRMRNDS